MNAFPVEHVRGERQSLALRSAEFRRGREHAWRQLDDLVSRAEASGISALSAEEVALLPLLHQAAMSSLSVARGIVLDRNLLLYLESLALRSYLVVYGPRVGMVRSMADFFKSGFPRAVRELRRHLALAAVLMLAGMVAGYVLVRADISYFNLLVPESLAGNRGPGSTAADLLTDELFAPWPGFVHTFVVFANFLFQHNTMVGIFCFGLGFALGVPTIMLLAYNGLALGAMIALHAEKGLTIDFVGWLSIHGVTELLAILLCGAAGFVIAEKILFPGPLSRLESLAIYGRRAAGVAAGCVTLFMIAGILEGGFRQLIANTPGRYVFALVSALVWLCYFYYAGREKTGGMNDAAAD